MTCCERPDPAILEKNHRPFCRNCRRYLDVVKADEDPPPYEPPSDTSSEEAPTED